MAKIRKTAVVQSKPAEEKEPAVNKYFILVSERYMRAKYATIIVLALFLAVVLILFRSDITYANLMYLLRDFNTGEAVYTSVFDPIRYDEQDNMSFAVYRGELAVIGNRNLRLYNSKGEENRSYSLGYSDPVIISSDKYLLVHDIGTESYSLFTSIAKVNDGVATGSIEGADINDNGEYLLVCKSTETKYVVSTFDSSFRPIANYYKNSYVTSAAIGDDGTTVIASFRGDGDGYSCEIDFYPDGAEEPSGVYTAAGVFPVKCGVWDDGRAYVICSDRVLFFDKGGKLASTYESWSGFTAYAEGNNSLAVSRSEDAIGSDSDAVVFNTTGETIFTKTIDGKISSLAITDKTLFVLAGNNVSMIPVAGGDIITESVDDAGAELVASDASVILCGRNSAIGLVFDNNADVPVTSAVTNEQN